MSSKAFRLQLYYLNTYPVICPPTPYIEGFEFFQTVLNILAPLLIILGTYGVVVILFATPPEMKSAKWVLLLSHLSSFYLGFVSDVLTKPFIYSPSVAIYATGFLLKIGVPFRFAMWIGQTSYPVYEIALVMLFENRYSHISNYPKFIMRTKTRVWVFILHYLVFLSMFALNLFISLDDDSEKLEILKTMPCPEHHFFQEATHVVTTYTRIQSLTTAFQSVYLFGFSFILAFLTGYCLLSKNSATSQKTREMQKKFLIALTIQVLVPFVVLFIPFALYWSFMVLGVVLPIVRSLNIFCVALHGIVSGFLLIFLHKPYREFTFGSMPHDHSKVHPRRTSAISIAGAVN